MSIVNRNCNKGLQLSGSNSKTVFFKSEKASYIMLRKYFDEIEEKIEMLQKK